MQQNRMSPQGRQHEAAVPIAADVKLGAGVVIAHPDLVNLYGCTIGDDTSIGPFVEIQNDTRIGRRCKISSHSFICSGVDIEDEVFVGHGVLFINDRYPQAAASGRRLQAHEWKLEPIRIRHGVALGSGAVIMCGITIEAGATIGAGAIVTRNVPAGSVVTGSPARRMLQTRLRR
jgi:UDP-2-acetamido-3-amino-2,3-dideoxy-glucuronate N-acetyltransferase